MIKRIAQVLGATALGFGAAAAFALPAQAAGQFDVWDGFGQTGGFDYRTSSDTTFANNTFNNGVGLDNRISSVVSYNATGRLCTGTNYTGSCPVTPSNTLVDLGAGLNNAYSSVRF